MIPQINPCRKRYTDLLPTDKVRDLDNLLSSVQRHSRCGDHCLRRKRNSGPNSRMVCRFGFPIALEEESSLRHENGTWKFIPKRNDALLQRYNRFVTQVWRGNTDFSAITSKDAVINYISKYASKGEHASEAYSEILRRVINRNPQDAPAATLVRQLLVSSVAERNFSAQEVMHLLMGWPLYRASRSVVVVSLRDDWRQLRENSNSIVKQYSIRHQDFSTICLFEYAKNYYYARGRTVKRRKECIVRVIPYIAFADDANSNEEYYELQCKLFIPWMQNFDRLRPENVSWEDLYIRNIRNIAQPDSFDDSFNHLPEDVQFEGPEDAFDVLRDAGQAASRLHPRADTPDPIGQRPIDEAYQWESLADNSLNPDQVNEFLRTYDRAPGAARLDGPTVSLESLSPAQTEVLCICRLQIADPLHDIRRIIVQGKAGTGKSCVIKSLCHMLDTIEPRTARSYQVLAPTGAAALNIDGKTIHSFLKIPIRSREMLPLNGHNLRIFQVQLTNIKFIIIDEYSMIGFRMLHMIHQRLCEARGRSDQPFGGFFIYFFGDLRQLPPILDTPIYMEPRDDISRRGLNLINSIQKTIILTICHRQSSSETEFKQVLDNLATGRVTLQNWELLMTRRASINPQEEQTFKNSIHLFPSNEKVDEHNARVLSENGQPVAIIDSLHNNSTARQASLDMAQGLSRRLHLSINCRVMLRRNICVERGLVNGSIGTVRKIIYQPNERPPELPFAIFIEFDQYNGPFITDNLFPLLPFVTNWKDGAVDCSRKQFPLSLAYAFTIHKAQGLTLDRATIDIGSSERWSGVTYVALSRVRRLQDLLFSKPFNFSRLSGIGNTPQVIARERFLQSIVRN